MKAGITASATPLPEVKKCESTARTPGSAANGVQRE